MDIHVYVHWRDDLDCQIARLGEHMAKKFEEVDAKLDAVIAGIQELAREIQALVAAGPGPVSQEQLDSLDAKLTSALDAAKAADPHP